MASIFQPVVRINYHGDITQQGAIVAVERAIVQTYDLYGKAHTVPNREIPVDQIPLLLFQLVERGYDVSLDNDFDSLGIGAKSILAVSKEWIATARQRLEKKSEAV